MSIAEALADREARNAFALATGFSLDHVDHVEDVGAAIEKSSRRARWNRRRGAKGNRSL